MIIQNNLEDKPETQFNGVGNTIAKIKQEIYEFENEGHKILNDHMTYEKGREYKYNMRKTKLMDKINDLVEAREANIRKASAHALIKKGKLLSYDSETEKNTDLLQLNMVLQDSELEDMERYYQKIDSPKKANLLAGILKEKYQLKDKNVKAIEGLIENKENQFEEIAELNKTRKQLNVLKNSLNDTKNLASMHVELAEERIQDKLKNPGQEPKEKREELTLNGMGNIIEDIKDNLGRV